MSLTKITNLTKNFVNVLGKRSILQTKTQNLKNTKFTDLGIVFPNGEIQFQNTEAAISYAKTRCVKALNETSPFERSIQISKNRIIQEIDGDSNSVLVLSFGDNLTEIGCHGHPDTYAKGMTAAPSCGDYKCLMLAPLQKKEIVFNSKGEHYILEKKSNYKFDSDEKIFGSYTQVDVDRLQTLFKALPKTYQEELEIAIKNNNLEDFETLLKKALEKYQEPRDLPKALVDKTHEFWLKFAEKYGIKIETNFSNFI